jgi:hypothetical protein
LRRLVGQDVSIERAAALLELDATEGRRLNETRGVGGSSHVTGGRKLCPAAGHRRTQPAGEADPVAHVTVVSRAHPRMVQVGDAIRAQNCPLGGQTSPANDLARNRRVWSPVRAHPPVSVRLSTDPPVGLGARTRERQGRWDNCGCASRDTAWFGPLRWTYTFTSSNPATLRGSTICSWRPPSGRPRRSGTLRAHQARTCPLRLGRHERLPKPRPP